MNIKDQLKELPYIRKDNFALLFPGIKHASFDQNIKNWLKGGVIIKIKRGLYISSEYWKNCANKDEYLYYLSSLAYAPSYISKETVLARYGILSEAVFGISAVTSKNTADFKTKVGNFSYSKIRDELFTGFTSEEFSSRPFSIASKSKALFDFLYFAKRSLRRVNRKTVAELRVNAGMLSAKDWREFENYLRISGSEKMRRIYKLLRGRDAA